MTKLRTELAVSEIYRDLEQRLQIVERNREQALSTMESAKREVLEMTAVAQALADLMVFLEEKETIPHD